MPTAFTNTANGIFEILPNLNYSTAQRILARICSSQAGALELQATVDSGATYVTIEQVLTTAITTLGSYGKVAVMDILAPAQGRLIFRDTTGNTSAGVYDVRVYNDNAR